MVDKLFPFLIGTVRTKGLLDNDSDDEDVSIPHRYGKNANVAEKALLPNRFHSS